MLHLIHYTSAAFGEIVQNLNGLFEPGDGSYTEVAHARATKGLARMTALKAAAYANGTILNDGYAERIIGEDAARYDMLEIHGVRNLNAADDPAGTCCEVCDEDPETFSVYVHYKPTDCGGLECVGDFATHSFAVAYANTLGQKYGWQINDCVPSELAQ